jgi:AGCS family alanine or glycine:cation symporter
MPALRRLAAVLLLSITSLAAQETPAPAAPLVPPAAASAPVEGRIDQKIDAFFKPLAEFAGDTILRPVEIGGVKVPWVVFWLAAAGLILTVYFRFVNIRSFPLALRTVRGKYSKPSDPGEVTHFQALSAAVSGTVGLGNIAGVAIGVANGGPGVVFWLFVSGFIGMTTKFAECTLGVKYREFGKDGTVHGGGMYYLKKGFAERGYANLGAGLAFFFAICCVFASFGGGNIFQVNQTVAQLVEISGGKGSFFDRNSYLAGIVMAALTGMVIIGGIKGIAKVTGRLVPAMCLIYVISSLLVLLTNITAIPAAVSLIVSEAFTLKAGATSGLLIAFIWGMRRATFSNEAGIGSAPIAHAAAKTSKPASEGVVALLEPFLDTVIICTMTGLVLVITGNTTTPAGEFASPGVTMASNAFCTLHGGFKYILFLSVFLFAFSTLITWSYYGLQSWQYVFGRSKTSGGIYKLIFLAFIIIGSAASLTNAVDFSDAALFSMSIPNLIGVYFLLPVIKHEYTDFLDHAKKTDAQG